MARKETGIRSWKGGWQAYVQIQGKPYAKSFPRSTPIDVLRTWREDQRRRYARVGPLTGSFAHDVQQYLTRVVAMPTYKQRRAHLDLWLAALGRDRARASITTAEVEQVMQEWLQAGTAPATVRKRRTALLSLFHRLDGKQATNAVRASSGPRGPKPEARGLDYPTIDRILAQMPESRTKRRVAVLAYTGLPPSLLATVTPFDVDLQAKTVRVRPRRKGAGVEARTVPLTPDGVKAFRAFHRHHDYGPFAKNWTVFAARSFKRGCARADVTGVRLYDLRHSFGALLYRTTRDLATVARFLLHASLSTTARYAQAAMKAVDAAAAAKAGAVLLAERRRVRLAQRNLSPAPVPSAKRHRAM